jgi:hypothetical protein
MPFVGTFPYPNASDAPDGPGAFLALATAADALSSRVDAGDPRIFIQEAEPTGVPLNSIHIW